MIKTIVMSVALLLLLTVVGCSNKNTITHYDDKGLVTKVENVKGSDFDSYGRSKVEFKRSDTERIIGQSNAMKGLVTPATTVQEEPQPLGGSLVQEDTAAVLLKVIIAREIKDLKPQEYGEEAPTTWTEAAPKLLQELKEGILGFKLIDGAVDLGKTALDEAGPKIDVGGDLTGGDKTDIVVTPESEESEEESEEVTEETIEPKEVVK